jgi:hypothetical protein
MNFRLWYSPLCKCLFWFSHCATISLVVVLSFCNYFFFWFSHLCNYLSCTCTLLLQPLSLVLSFLRLLPLYSPLCKCLCWFSHLCNYCISLVLVLSFCNHFLLYPPPCNYCLWCFPSCNYLLWNSPL